MQGPLHRLFGAEALLAMTPDGLDELELLGSVEIAFNSAVALLDGTKVASLLEIVDVLFRHPCAARQQLGHGVEIS